MINVFLVAKGIYGRILLWVRTTLDEQPDVVNLPGGRRHVDRVELPLLQARVAVPVLDERRGAGLGADVRPGVEEEAHHVSTLGECG